MRNITGTVEDHTNKRGRVVAAERDSSLSASEHLKRQEREIRSPSKSFTASGRISRDEVHDRTR